MKMRHLLTEEKQTHKIITIECSDGEGELEKFLEWWKSMGDIGHSAMVHCDVEYDKDSIVKIYCDGDGSDKIYNMSIKTIEV